jgi:hypothetical protein
MKRKLDTAASTISFKLQQYILSAWPHFCNNKVIQLFGRMNLIETAVTCNLSITAMNNNVSTNGLACSPFIAQCGQPRS